MDGISGNVTAIDTSWRVSIVYATKVNSLIPTILKDITICTEWQSSSVGEIPVSTMDTLTTTTTCVQVSDTLNTVTTTGIISHFTEVHIGVVGQSLASEGDVRSRLAVDLHQRPEETQQTHNSHDVEHHSNHS